MERRASAREPKGSRRSAIEWFGLQPRLVDEHLAGWGSLCSFRSGAELRWLWRRSEPFGELRDDLWKTAGLPGPSPQRAGWWPRWGPQWDGVAIVPGRRGRPGLLLVEAKGHLGEVESTCRARPGSRLIINRALEETKAALGADPEADWLTHRYQHANRLAWLHYLRAHAGVEAFLAFVHFTADPDEWLDSIVATQRHLGLPRDHALADHVRWMFMPERPPAEAIERSIFGG